MRKMQVQVAKRRRGAGTQEGRNRPTTSSGPGLDDAGHEAVWRSWTRIEGKSPEIEIILLTGMGGSAEAARGIHQGAFDCLVKPLNIDKLIERIGRRVEKAIRDGKLDGTGQGRIHGQGDCRYNPRIEERVGNYKGIRGCMEDLIALDGKNTFPNKDRVPLTMSRIMAQVTRGVDLSTRLNGFAHSADETKALVDLSEAVELTGRSAPQARARRG